MLNGRDSSFPACDRMKVLLISPTCMTIPVERYGGIESVLWDFAEVLPTLGVETVLAAPKGSKAPKGCELIETVDLRFHAGFGDAEVLAYEWYRQRLKEFNCVHDFSHAKIPSMVDPSLRSLNVCWFDPVWFTEQRGGQPHPMPHNVVCLSRHQTERFRRVYGREACYQPTICRDSDVYKFSKRKGERFLFVGKMSWHKGCLEAIKFCRELGVPLDICGGFGVGDPPHYMIEVLNECDDEQICFYPNVIDEVKIELMRHARGVLYPIQYIEPHNMVLVESQLCFPRETHVRTFGVVKVLSRTFNGNLIEIGTERGYKVRATPNHPFLTPKGWKPAKYLNEGDYTYSWCSANGRKEDVDGERIGDTYEELEEANQRVSKTDSKSSDNYKMENGETWSPNKATVKDQNQNVECKFRGEGYGILGWHDRRGRNNYPSLVVSWEGKEDPFSVNSNIKQLRAINEMVDKEAPLQEYSLREETLHLRREENRSLRLPYERFCFTPTSHKIRALPNRKKASCKSFKKVDGKQVKKIPLRRILGIRGRTIPSNTMVELERVEKIRKVKTENIRVYNLTTIHGVYFANDLLVHNCGTPCVTFNKGAMSKVVEDGVTGFVADSDDDFKRAMKRVDELDPKMIRREALKRYDRRKVVGDYLGLYKSVSEGLRW